MFKEHMHKGSVLLVLNAERLTFITVYSAFMA